MLNLKWKTRWWFPIYFIFSPTWGRFPFWLIFFQKGWFNHHLEKPRFAEDSVFLFICSTRATWLLLGLGEGPCVQNENPGCRTCRIMLTLQGINISHLGKRKLIFKTALERDMLVPRRVVLNVIRYVFVNCLISWLPMRNPLWARFGVGKTCFCFACTQEIWSCLWRYTFSMLRHQRGPFLNMKQFQERSTG